MGLKVKKKLFLCFFFQLSTTPWKCIGEWRYASTHSLTSALDGGEWSASPPGSFIPRGRAPGTHWTWGWVGLRAGLDAVVKKKLPAPAGTRTSDHPARSPALYHWSIPAPLCPYWGKVRKWNCVPVLYQVPRHKNLRGIGGIAPHIINFGIIWRWVVSSTPWPLYPRRKDSRCALVTRLGGEGRHQSRQERRFFYGPYPCHYTDWATPACREDF
jgi:hypothetical protein